MIDEFDSLNWDKSADEVERLREISAELLEALKDLLAWANMDASTNPTTIAVREKCKAVIAKAEGTHGRTK